MPFSQELPPAPEAWASKYLQTTFQCGPVHLQVEFPSVDVSETPGMDKSGLAYLSGRTPAGREAGWCLGTGRHRAKPVELVTSRARPPQIDRRVRSSSSFIRFCQIALFFIFVPVFAIMSLDNLMDRNWLSCFNVFLWFLVRLSIFSCVYGPFRFLLL